jgi:hypothetical protein
MPETKDCFVIAPIGESESETRKRSDQVLKHIIRPAVESCGYKAIRADEIDKPGMITSQVIQRVVDNALVVADLTERNPNVFYELAIRHALRRPLVQLIKKGEQIPFDVAGTRTIQVDHRDLDSVEAAKNEIMEQVRSLERDPSALETPISMSLDLQILRQSEKPEDRSLADLVAAVSSVSNSLSRVETKIGTQDGGGIFDEIKQSIKVLEHRLLREFDSPFGLGNGRAIRFHPRMFRELLHTSPGYATNGIEILVIASLFRDSMPWIYELGLDAYRKFKSRSSKSEEAFEIFRRMIHYSIHGPLAELFRHRKETFLIFEEIEPLLEEMYSRSMFRKGLKNGG